MPIPRTGLAPGIKMGENTVYLGNRPQKLYPARLQTEGNSCSLGYCKCRDALVDGVVAQEWQPFATSSGEAGKQDGSACGGREDPLPA